MSWMIYALGALTLGACALALYEWRKGRRMRVDAGRDPTRDPERAAFTEAERIRGEANIAHPPHGGGIF